MREESAKIDLLVLVANEYTVALEHVGISLLMIPVSQLFDLSKNTQC
ncbi:Uncharacterised protein [uncultured archaeon]|nr:Uncharacterised protein [uncultured archaeon]